MDLTLQIFVVMTIVMLSGLGVMSMFAPQRMVANFAIEPIGIAGLSTVRSVIGGFFLASVAMLAYGLWSSQTFGFLAVATLMGVVAIGRIIGMIADGFDKAVVPPLVVELVIIAVLVAADWRLSA